jgi:hypothetical protein
MSKVMLKVTEQNDGIGVSGLAVLANHLITLVLLDMSCANELSHKLQRILYW